MNRAMTCSIRAAACAAGAGLLVLVPTNAFAGDLNTWSNLTQLSATGFPAVENFTQPTVVRESPNLRVVWHRNLGASPAHPLGFNDYQSTVLTARGATLVPRARVYAAAQLDPNPKLVIDQGGTRLATTGYDTSIGLDGRAYPLQVTPSGLWTRGAALSQTTSASGNTGLDAISYPPGPGPTMWISTLTATSTQLTWNSGTVGDSAVNRGSSFNHFPGVARDRATGEVWAVFQNNSSNATQMGYNAVRLNNGSGVADSTITNLGGPCAVTSGVRNCDLELQRAGIAARFGGGVYLVTGKGYLETTRSLIVRRLGSTDVLPVPGSTNHPRAAVLSPTADGRLWVAWVKDDKVYATRSNRSVTQFGKVRVLASPTAATVYHLAADAGVDRLDLVATARSATSLSLINVFHRQVQPGLTVQVVGGAITRLSGGTLKVLITDAGDAVAGAVLRYAGATATSGPSGYASLRVNSGLSRGTKTASVSRSGYASTTVSFRVS